MSQSPRALAPVTQDAMASFAHCDNPRLAEVMALLVKHLHAFVVQAQLSKEEWMQGLQFLTACAAITDEERNEFSLLSDIMGISSIVDLVSQPEGGTPSSVLGPFHNHDSLMRSNGVDLAQDQAGERVWFHGCVRDVQGHPIAHAELDFWQNAHNGLYPAQDPEQDPHNLRCKLTCDAQGCFELITIRPRPYTVPTDGPVGALLAASRRSIWRPAHYHVIVSAPGHVGLVTELFPQDSDHIDNDTVFGVRPGLVVPFQPCENPDVAHRLNIQGPLLEVRYDFVLVRSR